LLVRLLCLIGFPTIELLGAATPASAQLLRRENVALSTGVVYYRSGAPEPNCPDAVGISFGFDFQTTGTWHAGGGMRMFLAGTLMCGGASILVQHHGESLNEESGLQLWGMPSLELHAGRILTWDELELALAAAAKLTYGYHGPDRTLGSFVPWVGGRLTLEGITDVLGVGLEIGRHRTTVSWLSSNQTVVRTFGRWEPLGQLTLRIRPWREYAEGGR
jgi:hypothetical protein